MPRTTLPAHRRWTIAAIGLLMLGASHAADRHAGTIEAVLRQLHEYYVHPEVAAAMATSLHAKQAEGAYEALAEGEPLATALTRDLQAVSGDGHIHVSYSARALPEDPVEAAQEDAAADLEAIRADIARRYGDGNFGSERVEVLPGNIGYYKVNVLTEPHFSRARHAAAMSLLAGTQALILDFRDNRGAIGFGSVEELASYFFERPTHLSDLYWREFDRTESSDTHDAIPGPKYLDRPVYLLTSRFTYSGAEALASQLQAHGRIRIVGERSGGGANPGRPRRADAHYTVFVPNGLVTNAVTGDNWEGRGVRPDIATPAQKAPWVAQQLALAELLARTPEHDTERRNRLVEAQQRVVAALARFRPVEFSLPGHADAGEVRVAADFNHWRGAALPLQREGGRWVGRTELAPGRYAYRFEVDGRPVEDPANPGLASGGNGPHAVREVVASE